MSAQMDMRRLRDQEEERKHEEEEDEGVSKANESLDSLPFILRYLCSRKEAFHFLLM